MKRSRRNYVSVDVEVNLDDVLSDIDDETLLEIVAERGIQGGSLGCSEPDAALALRYLKLGDFAEAELILERALNPKFVNLGACMSLFAQATGKDAWS